MKFTTDNTTGYTIEQLKLMNEIYEREISTLDETEIDYADQCSHCESRAIDAVESMIIKGEI